MGLKEDLEAAAASVLNATWNARDGQVVPETGQVVLANGAVNLDAVLLYADLANSTRLARLASHSVAAKVVRTFLSTVTRLINDAGGKVRSFDGDRVMGVFVGPTKNTDAARCALKINYAVLEILRPKIALKYPALGKRNFTVAHCTGVASSKVLVVRGGVRGSNDLVFVGTAPNIAAKLSEIRNAPWHTYITKSVYDSLLPASKLGGKEPKDMWTAVTRTIDGQTWTLYRSGWTWKP
jgi:class 3 adenylate cyclase